MERMLSANMLWLCIDVCTQSEITGRIYTMLDQKVIPFNDFNQLVLRGDEVFNHVECPQAFQMKRSFQIETREEEFSSKRKHMMLGKDNVMKHHGDLFDCIILVETRQHANWQGKLLDQNFEEKKKFLDVVELMNLLLEISKGK